MVQILLENKPITSTANSRVKSFLRYRNKRYSKKNNAFIVEGIKEISLAIKYQYKILEIYICPTLVSSKILVKLFPQNKFPKDVFHTVSANVFSKMVYRDSSQGIVALVERKFHKLTDIILSKNPSVLVVEKVEKPGNLGAVLRTADAAKIDGIIFCDLNTDIYNSNVIRASLGTIFSVPFAVVDNDSAIKFLNDNKINIYATSLSSKISLYKPDFRMPTAFVIGTEAQGISAIWLENAKQNIIIPMYGNSDSLNTSVTAAILLYELLRQRKFSTPS